MKYALGILLLVVTSLAYPLGESDEVQPQSLEEPKPEEKTPDHPIVHDPIPESHEAQRDESRNESAESVESVAISDESNESPQETQKPIEPTKKLVSNDEMQRSIEASEESNEERRIDEPRAEASQVKPEEPSQKTEKSSWKPIVQEEESNVPHQDAPEKVEHESELEQTQLLDDNASATREIAEPAKEDVPIAIKDGQKEVKSIELAPLVEESQPSEQKVEQPIIAEERAPEVRLAVPEKIKLELTIAQQPEQEQQPQRIQKQENQSDKGQESEAVVAVAEKATDEKPLEQPRNAPDELPKSSLEENKSEESQNLPSLLEEKPDVEKQDRKEEVPKEQPALVEQEVKQPQKLLVEASAKALPQEQVPEKIEESEKKGKAEELAQPIPEQPEKVEEEQKPKEQLQADEQKVQPPSEVEVPAKITEAPKQTLEEEQKPAESAPILTQKPPKTEEQQSTALPEKEQQPTVLPQADAQPIAPISEPSS